jgi:hypothetical protein
MSAFPGSPRLLKGAIIGLDPFNPVASIIVFQYNPDTMSRRVDARTTGSDDNDRGEALRLIGPPRETISFSIEIDVTDALERSDPLAGLFGAHPTLAALEMLLYPKAAAVIKNLALAALGTIEVIPPEAPLTLFVWGPSRVLPVRLTSLSIAEEAHDTTLNPIRARVDLSLSVLSYYDLNLSNPGHAIFLAHQIAKEALAVSNTVVSAANGATLKVF